MTYATLDVVHKSAKMMFSIWFVLFCVGILPAQSVARVPVSAAAAASEDSRTVSLLIADQGESLYSALGHAAIRVCDSLAGTDYVYTYEGEPVGNQLFRFLSGQLHMGMFCVPTLYMCAMYETEGRGVRAYRMNLSPEASDRLLSQLQARVAEGINLPYDYYHRGCAQTIVEMVSASVDSIVYAPWTDKYIGQTQRELCYQGGAGRPWAQFWTFTLIGNGPDEVDIPCEDKLLVPNDLLEVWQKATVDGHPLVSDEAEVLAPADPQEKSQVQRLACTPLLIACVLLVIVVASLIVRLCADGRWVAWIGLLTDSLMLAVVSLLGCLETYLVLFSSLPCSAWHWLLIPLNILPLLLWPWRRNWALPWAVLLTVWWIGIVAWPHQLVTPAHLVLVAAEIVWMFSQKSQVASNKINT